MGWLSGWQYRKKVTISGSSGAGENYQVKLSIGSSSGGDFHLEGHCTDFPNDIRFTDDDGETLLDYWIEDPTQDPITVWVEVKDSLDNDVDIYVYYDNPSASSASDFDDTFIFGDPFDNATLDATRWTSVDGNPTYSIDATNHYLEITDMDGNNWQNGKGFHSKTISLPSEWIIEDAYSSDGFGMYHHSTVNSDIFAHLFSLHHTDFSDSDWGIAFFRIADSWSADRNIGNFAGVGGNDDYHSGEISPSLPVSYRIKMWKLAGNIHITQDDTERVVEANAETPDRIHLGIERYSTYSFGTKRFYAFKVRKYASPEPSFSSAGSEEELSFTCIDISSLTSSPLPFQELHTLCSEILKTSGFSSSLLSVLLNSQDNFGFFDNASSLLSMLCQSTDKFGGTDSELSQLSLLTTLLDKLHQHDSSASNITLERTILDILTFQDTSVLLTSIIASASGILKVYDLNSVRLTFSCSSIDIIKNADTSGVNVTFHLSTNDIFKGTDFVSGHLQAILSALDTLKITDSSLSSIFAGILVSASDVLATSDYNAIRLEFLESSMDIIKSKDSSSSIISFQLNSTDVLHGIDVLTANLQAILGAISKFKNSDETSSYEVIIGIPVKIFKAQEKVLVFRAKKSHLGSE